MSTKEKKSSKKKEKKVEKVEEKVEEAPAEAPAPVTETEPVVEPVAEIEPVAPPPESSVAAPDESVTAPAPEPEPAADKRKEEKREAPKEPKRVQRATSNVFALFNQSQIQEFKEAFTMIDQNRDGLIDVNDLVAIYQHIGREPEAKILEEMVSEAPGPINFTMFLGLFGDRLKGTDSETALRDAFVMFDTDGKGKIPEEYLKDLLMNVGDQFSKEEIKQVWKEIPNEGGYVDYHKFVHIIKRGKDED